MTRVISCLRGICAMMIPNETNLARARLSARTSSVWVVSALLLPSSWRIFSPMLGIEAPLGGFFTPGMPVLLFLVIYAIFPWWQRRMGQLFLPFALFLLALQAIFGNYLTLLWLVPSHTRELAVLLFMSRVWINLQFIVLFVAWQYDLLW